MKVPYGDQGLYILETAGWRTHRPVIDKDTCINCGICREECPKGAIDWVKEEK